MVRKPANYSKKAILTLLYEHRNEFLSGQKISELIGCSRTAVWKHIQSLLEEGFLIESVQKKGYRLMQSPDGLNEPAVAAGLKTKRLGRTIRFYESIESTQKEALRLADEGAEDGTVVLTNEQTNGRGRLGHTWQSQRGTNIAMSMILRPSLPIEKTPQLTLLTAVAATDVIEKVTGLTCGIKWPNDILYNGKKLVGILTELQAEATYVKAVVIGIGINVNGDLSDLPESVRQVAGSLELITGKRYALAPFIQEFFECFEALYTTYLHEGFQSIRPLWEQRALNLGNVIKVRKPGGHILEGVARGINNEGVLLLQKSDGTLAQVYSADIEWDK
ncbi:biotin--[acetyl-CoA-carboxylase] ligase [Sporolactobacillus shoreicorticis]|uniref:Bifunctional ligase/repressor BirA n=1 Tax=Sporolactobacillus shoreicorticis TaxID=1923877 RepID=A0ABW5S662_9BACL|nr:biotin--[acetyl-CoA-carboxylase] ligase [Sporolactobacillus shoreicorticis]MCO7125776.1 biotin--[acetyl-CoA-carboxylase] ligase [Sporolactobacillus shoreicorticis]